MPFPAYLKDAISTYFDTRDLDKDGNFPRISIPLSRDQSDLPYLDFLKRCNSVIAFFDGLPEERKLSISLALLLDPNLQKSAWILMDNLVLRFEEMLLAISSGIMDVQFVNEELPGADVDYLQELERSTVYAVLFDAEEKLQSLLCLFPALSNAELAMDEEAWNHYYSYLISFAWTASTLRRNLSEYSYEQSENDWEIHSGTDALLDLASQIYDGAQAILQKISLKQQGLS